MSDNLTDEDILALMKRAVFDSVIYCGFCEYTPLEADYDSCPECGKPNPLKARGMI